MALLSYRYMVLKSQQSHLYVGYNRSEGNNNGLLNFTTDQVVSPFTKLEVEQARIGNGLVHIRCCYNNKYWVLESGGQGKWIKAAANEPGEDTLFEPVQVSRSDTEEEEFRFRHVKSKKFVRQASSFLCAESSDPDASSLSDVYTIVNWERLSVLPLHVAFKGDNGKYLRVVFLGANTPFLQFSADDATDPAALHKVVTNGDGSVSIMNYKVENFWRRSPDWIWADSVLDNNNKDLMFWPVTLGEKVFALMNLGNQCFCKRLTNYWENCLHASLPTVDSYARLQVEEVVVSRNIENVDFHLDDAKVYNQKVVKFAEAEAANYSQQPNTVDLKFSYKTSTTRTFNSSVSYKESLTMSFGGQIPVIGFEAKVGLTEETVTEFEWGKSETEEKLLEYKVTVPPISRVKVSLLASHASCDVPFSYTQRDTLIDGTVVRTDMDDGVYTGSNYYDFKYITKQESL